MITIREAQAACGTTSSPSKMPGKAIGTPASKCITGSKLRNVPGSVCEGCYAFLHAYTWPVVQNAYMNRWDKVMQSKDNPDPWIQGMVRLTQNEEYFRWDDSGDLQGNWHFANIVEVAKRTPNTHHWLPTREYRMVEEYQGDIPTNLVVRESAHMVDAPPPITKFNTSTVVTDGSETCPSLKQGNSCGDCRNCWDPQVKNVSYKKHK